VCICVLAKMSLLQLGVLLRMKGHFQIMAIMVLAAVASSLLWRFLQFASNTEVPLAVGCGCYHSGHLVVIVDEGQGVQLVSRLSKMPGRHLLAVDDLSLLHSDDRAVGVVRIRLPMLGNLTQLLHGGSSLQETLFRLGTSLVLMWCLLYNRITAARITLVCLLFVALRLECVFTMQWLAMNCPQ
jgi:hypothetical protein